MSDPRKILVIQLRRIGDVILTTPALAALRRRFPEATIDFLVEAPGAEALADNPNISEVLVYRAGGLLDWLGWIRMIRRRRYDWVIDYMGNPRSAFITFFSAAALRAGPSHVGHRWAYNHPLVQSDKTCYAGLEKMKVLRTLGIESGGADFMPKVYFPAEPAQANRIGLAPASRKVTRRWPAASYAALGRLLRERHGCRLLVFWGPGEKELAEEVARGIGEGAEITPETTTLQAAARLMAGCRLIITNCSGSKHLASALGVPTLTIHGSSDPASWTPPHPSHLAVRLEQLHCIGCQLNDCPYGLECMKQLSPETVCAAADSLLAGLRRIAA
jgi:ADP-heptose:LPS heptosyltransferase